MPLLSSYNDAKARLAAMKRSCALNRAQPIQALSALVADDPLNEEVVLAGFNSLPWLAQEPLWACLAFPGVSSLVAAAIVAGSPSALRELDSMGASLWLAADQNGFSDACVWTLALLCQTPNVDEILPHVARALLSDASDVSDEDPFSFCSRLASQVAFDSDDPAHRDLPARLIAALEAEAIELCLPIASTRASRNAL